MNCIDFDAHFADYTAQWMKEHTKDYRNYDEMEEDMPNVYMTFLNTPASWLQGVTPAHTSPSMKMPRIWWTG